jgi:diacylglycerol kinase family enzyme
MRVSLLYHSGAGDGISLKSLVREISKAGHTIDHVIEDAADLESKLDGLTEVLVAVGGDGTVKRAAFTLAGTSIALAILPVGTANNVARSLGIQGSIPDLVARWANARRRPLDIGLVREELEVSRFLEGVGAGLIPAAIAAVKAHADDAVDESAARLNQAGRRFLDVLPDLEPRYAAITLDGVRSEGEFLLLEVLNTHSLGPNLRLSMDADPSDGLLSVVAIGESRRHELYDSLRAQIDRGEFGFSFPAQHAREVGIEGWNEMHIDGSVHRWSEAAPVSIRIEAGAVEYLSS